ncbi:MAG: hypothetical protein QOE54_6636 [Streptosporangiaceae bacterium]|nr:hypothetical protein [Streptosporangiaceae bacterium]
MWNSPASRAATPSRWCGPPSAWTAGWKQDRHPAPSWSGRPARSARSSTSPPNNACTPCSTSSPSGGLRRAEIAGLPWADTDLDGSRTLTVRETRPDDGDDYDDTKSEAGERTIGLDQGTIKVVSAWRTRQKAEKLAAGPSWIDLGRVFTREDGSALRPGWISLRFDASIKQYNAIRRRHFDDEWPIERIARQHRINEDKARIAIERP